MYLSLAGLAMLVGLLIYMVIANSKWQEIGRIMYAFGLLALLVRADRFGKFFGQ